MINKTVNINIKEGQFKEHLLKRRLARVKTSQLKQYWENLIDLKNAKTQTEIIERIVKNYKIKIKNNDFANSFKDFVRDFVLTGREADYLIDVNQPLNILEWIKGWKEGRFNGQKYDFIFHTYLTLNPKKLALSSNDYISFPTMVIFLLGSRQLEANELNGLELITYSPTVEFEIIIRDNLRIVEIRGPYELAQDFVTTSIIDVNNPLSAARSYFVGNQDDVKTGRTVAPVRQIIKIESLRKLLSGKYTKLRSKYPGTVAKYFEVDLDNLDSVNDEQDRDAQAILTKIVKEPIKGSISFSYNGKSYTFSITKTGGLFLRKYIPEFVITYILGKIKLSSMGKDDSQSTKLPESIHKQ